MRYFEVVKDKYRRTKAEIQLPTRNDKGSAGYDIYTPEDIIIEPGKCITFPTDIKAFMDMDDVLMLYIRSSIGIKRKLMLMNGTGVIDSTYANNTSNDGNLLIALYNYGTETQVIKAGERVIQGVFIKYLVVDDDKSLNSQRIGRIGSSGK